MLRITEILDALEENFGKTFPNCMIYRNVVRRNFQRTSLLVEVSRQTMEDATRRTVDRTAQAKVTFFETVDDYHDTQVEVLEARLSAGMILLSKGVLPVEDRYLDISGVTGEVYNDYAELTFTLSWQDDRELAAQDAALLENIDITVDCGGR